MRPVLITHCRQTDTRQMLMTGSTAKRYGGKSNITKKANIELREEEAMKAGRC